MTRANAELQVKRNHDVSDNFIDRIDQADFVTGIPYRFKLAGLPVGGAGNVWYPPGCWNAPNIASIWFCREPSYEIGRWMTSSVAKKPIAAKALLNSDHARRLSTHFFYRYNIASENCAHEDTLDSDVNGFKIHEITDAHATRWLEARDYWIRIDSYEGRSSRGEESETDEPGSDAVDATTDLVMIEIGFQRAKAVDAASILILGDASILSGANKLVGAELSDRAEAAAKTYSWSRQKYLAYVKSGVRSHLTHFLYGIRDRENQQRLFTKKLLQQQYLRKDAVMSA